MGRWIYAFVVYAVLASLVYLRFPQGSASDSIAYALGYPMFAMVLGMATMLVRTRNRPAAFVDYAVSSAIIGAVFGIAFVGRVMREGF